MLCVCERTEPGVSGLAVVAADGGDCGLVVVENEGAGESGLSRLGGTNDRPAICAANSAGLGFHELRWKLFFLRTLALYAARMTVVAWEGLVEQDDAELMLGARPCETTGDVVISRRGRVGGTSSSLRGDVGDGGEDEHVS